MKAKRFMLQDNETIQPCHPVQDADSQSCNEKQPCLIYEYCVLRYVADIEREEFVNIGLMMMCKRRIWMKVELMINEDRIHAMFRNADIERLRTQTTLYIKGDVPARGLPVEERYRWLAAVKSAIIQTSQSHPGIIRHNPDLSPSELHDLLSDHFDHLFNRLIR